MESVFGIFIVIIIWIFINYIVAYVSGWHKLALEYKTGNKVNGEAFYFRSGFGHWWCLTFIVSCEGLYMSALFPFNIGSSPLLIPWDEVEFIEKEDILDRRNILFPKVNVSIKLPEDILMACETARIKIK